MLSVVPIGNNLHEVSFSGKPIGYLEKLRNNATTKHPWKALNLEWKLVAAFYGKKDIDGGIDNPKQAAIDALMYSVDDVRDAIQ